MPPAPAPPAPLPPPPMLVDLCAESYWSAPGVVRMRAEGSAGQWATDLLRLAEHDELALLRGVLTDLARDGLRSLDPIFRFENEAAEAILPRQYADACAYALTHLRQSPGAAYLISAACVFGWARALGDRLMGQEDGYPDRGWVDIPHAFALAALKLGDARGAGRVVDLAYDTLMAARFHDHPALREGIARYRTLAGRAVRRIQQQIDNLADDLLRSTLRTHLLALMWTLGFVPECESLRGSGRTPSRTTVRTLIRLSLDRIPQDPLTQYVWLELKDKPSLDLRSHPFFYLINRRYGQYQPDVLWPVMPSQVYARTLIGWLSGSLGEDDIALFLEGIGHVREYEEVRRNLPGISDWSVYLRMISLAYLIAAEHDLLAGDPTPEEQLEVWRSLTGQVINMRGRHHLDPHRADLEGTLNYPLFHLIEQDTDRTRTIADLERYRAAGQAFSLAVNPPSPPAAVAGGDLERQLDAEDELIEWLRGAYFLVRYPFLPRHFRRFAAEGVPPPPVDHAAGRGDYLEVERRLEQVHEAMRPAAEHYAEVRRSPAATVESIVDALRQHTSS